MLFSVKQKRCNCNECGVSLPRNCKSWSLLLARLLGCKEIYSTGISWNERFYKLNWKSCWRQLSLLAVLKKVWWTIFILNYLIFKVLQNFVDSLLYLIFFVIIILFFIYRRYQISPSIVGHSQATLPCCGPSNDTAPHRSLCKSWQFEGNHHFRLLPCVWACPVYQWYDTGI